MRESYLLSRWEVALISFIAIFGALCLPVELFGRTWGADTIARFVVSGAAAIVAVVARWRREVAERALRPASWSVSEWRSAPDLGEYAETTIGAPFETRLGGLLVAAGLPVGRDLEYKVIVRVKGNG